MGVLDMKKKIRDLTVKEMKKEVAVLDYLQKYPDRYYVMKYALKINKEHISNLFKFKLGKKYLNSKIEKNVLDVLNQDILEQEIEV